MAIVFLQERMLPNNFAGKINDARTFIGIISLHSLQSLYVTFELGARWGREKHLIPLLAPGVPVSVLRSPLVELNALEASVPAQLHQLVADLAGELGAKTSSPAAYQLHIDAIQELARVNPVPSDVKTPGVEEVKESLTHPISVSLSTEAQTILRTAFADPDGSILSVTTMSGTHVQAGSVVLTEGLNRRAITRWESAIHELEAGGLIKDLGGKGEAFELTSVGWDVADALASA